MSCVFGFGRFPAGFLSLTLVLLTLFSHCQAWGAIPQVVIHEIMFHPTQPVDGPEPVGEEYIELFNRSGGAVDVSGWRFVRGVDFTFPALVIPAGGYVVVAADKAVFEAKYPGVSPVVGNLVGRLGNRWEAIRLEDGLGNKVDEVEYATSGDWSKRIKGPALAGTRGWDWEDLADGGGHSLERVNAEVWVDSGQNWARSVFPGGTPGAINSVKDPAAGPLILDVQHAPAIPLPSDVVFIRARVVGGEVSGREVRVHFRLANQVDAGAFEVAVMSDDGLQGDGAAGDGVYGARLVPRIEGAVVEFYVEARVVGGALRTWPAPSVNEAGELGQWANAQYQVDSGGTQHGQPIYRIVMTESERVRLRDINRSSDAAMNATFITQDGGGTEIRYLCGVRIRGAGSRNRTPPNYRVSIPTDHRWKGLAEINLNTQYTHSQLAGLRLASKAGALCAEIRVVQVRVNGSNLAASGVPQYGSYVCVEPFGTDWAERFFPEDSGGNLYRASVGNHTANLSALTSKANAVGQGYTKSSNHSVDDWTDLIALTQVLDKASDEEYAERVREWVDVEAWMRYFATMTLLTSMETSIATGRGDDYSLYRGELDPRFKLMIHDLDTVMGQGDTEGDLNASIFRMVPAVNGRANTFVMNRFMRHPEFAPIYFRELVRLIGTTFSASDVGSVLDSTLTPFVPSDVIEKMKQFQAARNIAVLAQIPMSLSVTSSLPSVNGVYRTTGNTVTLTGRGNALRTQRIRVHGQEVQWTPWLGTWVATNWVVEPGVHRWPVVEYDAEGAVVGQTFVDVWREGGAGAVHQGILAADQTWRAQDGPHQVTANVTVPAGRVLTIEAGASVVVSQGAGLTVEGSIQVLGTEENRVWMGVDPSGNATWKGIQVNNSPAESRLMHVDFQGATGGTHQLGASNSRLVVEGCTWSGGTQSVLELSNSSALIRNCVFPNLTGAEHVHGGPVPVGGSVVLEGNTFGSTTLLNDIIDFTGARRPGNALQIRNNVFLGASDDVLDLDGTDAWVEGNIFMHVHKNNPNVGDTSSAISYGADGGYAPHVVAVRNFFYDVDHVALCKEGGFLTLLHNTAFGIHVAAVNFSEPERNTRPGAGALLDGNIFYNPGGIVASNLQNRFPTNGAVVVTAVRNVILSGAFEVTGGDNRDLDPRFVGAVTNASTADEIRDILRLRLGSPAMGAGYNGIDLGAHVSAGATISGEPESGTELTSARLQVGGVGISNYVYRVDGGAWSSERSVLLPLQLNGLAAGVHQVEVLGRNLEGVQQSMDSPTRSRSWTVKSGQVGLRIQELMARNETAVEVGGEHPDWIELWNRSSQAVDLSGYGLSDDPEDPFKYRFPAGTILGAGQYWVGWGDKGDAAGRHLGFGIDQAGDSITLVNTQGLVVDQVEFGLQARDLTLGRDSRGEWVLCLPTPGKVNETVRMGDAGLLRINEWLANPSALSSDDFVELLNLDEAPVELSGLGLTDTVVGQPFRHVMAPRSFIAGGDYVVMRADGQVSKGADHLAFKLSSDQGVIAILDATGLVLDCVSYGPQNPDVSEGRSPNGSATVVSLKIPTPGSPNPLPEVGTEVTTTVVPLFGYETGWSFDASRRDLGVDWRGVNYSDTSWAVSNALFGVENNTTYPIPFTTPLPLSVGQVTYYFRKRFQFNGSTVGVRLWSTNLVDEGAAYYLNGFEAARLRVPANPGYGTFATGGPTPEGSYDVLELSAQHLVQGENVLAVEVHQISDNSPDVAFAMALSAVTSITNVLPRGVVLNEVLASNGSITNAAGGTPDWVELYNDSDQAKDLSGYGLSDDTTRPRRWVFPTGVTIPARGYLVVFLDSDALPTLSAGAVLNAGFGLDDRGDQLFLYDSPTRGGALLDSITFGLQAADFSLGRFVEGVDAKWGLAVPTPGAANLRVALGSPLGLRINEWMANPASGDDWFELYNPASQPVALAGLMLTDDLGRRDKFKIGALSFVGSFTNGFVRFIADDQTAKGFDHVNFKLGNSGESLGLTLSTGEAVDSITFGAQRSGVSQGRLPDGGDEVVSFAHSATPGDSNYLPSRQVVIHEVLTHTDAPLEDAVELFNQGEVTVDIGGWFLSDSLGSLRKYRIADGTRLGPGEFLVLFEYQFNPEPGARTSFSFSSARGDQVYLSAADAAGNLLGYRSVAKVGAAPNRVSFGRWEQSLGVDYPLLSGRSFGRDNPVSTNEFVLGTGASNLPPVLGPVVLSEIHYHPPDVGTNDNVLDEFVELHNPGTQPVSLFHAEYPTNTWRLRDAVEYVFPGGVSISPGGYVLVVSFSPTNAVAAAAFRTKYSVPAQVPLYGPYSGKLDNSSDDVELVAPDAVQLPPHPDAGFVPYYRVDRVRYSDSAPWPVAADRTISGNGASLQRRNVRSYGNEVTNWVAALPTAGRANGSSLAPIPVISAQPVDVFSLVGGSATFSVLAVGGEPLGYQWTLEGDVIPGATNATLTIAGVRTYDEGRYAVVVGSVAGAVRSGAARLRIGGPPVVLKGPSDLYLEAGDEGRFSVQAAGSEPLRYQWFRNGVLLAGASGKELVLSRVQAANEGQYSVSVSNTFGRLLSGVARLTLGRKPVFTFSLPPTLVVLAGNRASWTLAAEGTGPLSYQWFFQDVVVPGATDSTLVLDPVNVSQGGRYHVVVTNLFGSAASTESVLAVIPLPTVTVEASDANAGESGDTGAFTVSRSYVTNQPLAVQLSWGGSATAGVDFEAPPVQLIIPANQKTVSWLVSPLNDTVIEGNEVVTATVEGGKGYVVGVPSIASVTLVDDDLPDPGRTNVVTLIDWGHVWKYQQTANLDGVDWVNPVFDDSAWPAGPGPLGLEPDGLPIPIATPLTLGRRTYYFRTHFQIARNAGVTLTATNLIDDGAVVYLNGQPVYRVRMPETGVEYVTSALVSVGNATFSTGVDIPAAELRIGDNVVAVEVHQSGANSSDITFGWHLNASVVEIGVPRLSAISYSANSGLLMEIAGTPLIQYDVEYSDDLVSWRSLATVSTASNGRVTFVDPSVQRPGARFYRARTR